jgi:thiol-disulfide isomerase/thioredoxin
MRLITPLHYRAAAAALVVVVFVYLWYSYRRTSPATMTLYYTSWCGVCVAFKPLYLRFAARVRDRHPHLNVRIVDCTNDSEHCPPDLRGYPTIATCPGGSSHVTYHTGTKTLDQLDQLVAALVT